MSNTLFETLSKDIIDARRLYFKHEEPMTEQELADLKIKSSLLSTIKGEIETQDKVVKDGTAKSDEFILSYLNKLVNNIKDREKDGSATSLDQKEKAIIEGYLPKKLTREELEAAIEAELSKLDDVSMKSIGPVMKALKEQYGPVGFDGGTASEIIKAQVSK